MGLHWMFLQVKHYALVLQKCVQVYWVESHPQHYCGFRQNLELPLSFCLNIECSWTLLVVRLWLACVSYLRIHADKATCSFILDNSSQFTSHISEFLPTTLLQCKSVTFTLHIHVKKILNQVHADKHAVFSSFHFHFKEKRGAR